MAFAVVKYIDEDDALGIIPSKWIFPDSQHCYYPMSIKSNEGREKLIRNATNPDENWAICPIKILHKFETYSQARLKLKKAEETSNLDSDEEELQKRSKRKTKLYGYDDSDSELESMKPQKINKKNTVLSYPTPSSFHSETIVNNNEILNFPSISTMNKQVQDYQNPCSQETSDLPSYSYCTPSTKKQKATLRDCTNATSMVSTMRQNCSAPYSQNLLMRKTGPSSRTSSACSSPTLPYSSTFSDQDRFLLGQLQVTVASIAEQLSILTNKVDMLLPNHGNFVEREFELLGHLPLQNMDHFNEIEERCVDEQFANQLIKVLASVGGKDVRQCVNNIMRRLFSDKLAEQFSFSGKMIRESQKISFSSKRLCTSVHVAVRRIFKDTSDQRIRGVICTWLQQAKTRRNRRDQRSGNKKQHIDLIEDQNEDAEQENASD